MCLHNNRRAVSFPHTENGKGEQEHTQSLPDHQRLLFVQDAWELLGKDDRVQKVQNLVPLELVCLRQQPFSKVELSFLHY